MESQYEQTNLCPSEINSKSKDSNEKFKINYLNSTMNPKKEYLYFFLYKIVPKQNNYNKHSGVDKQQQNTAKVRLIESHPGENNIQMPELLNLSVKKGEYIYARPNDIVLIESCDHLVKLYLIFDGKLKKAVLSYTLKDTLIKLPKGLFLRLGRFCAVNTMRLSGGNFNVQSFEFDFKTSIKLKHPISQVFFNTIGIK